MLIDFFTQNHDSVSPPPLLEGQVALVPHFAAEEGKSQFTADVGQVMMVTANTVHFVHFGLGKRSEFNLQVWRNALGEAVANVVDSHHNTDILDLNLPININLPSGLVGTNPAFGTTALHEVGFATAQIIAGKLHNHDKPAENKISVWINVCGLNKAQFQNYLCGTAQGAFVTDALHWRPLQTADYSGESLPDLFEGEQSPKG
jgi:hypothetical protein